MGHIEFCVVQVKIHFFLDNYTASLKLGISNMKAVKNVFFFSLPKLQTPELGREQFFLF